MCIHHRLVRSYLSEGEKGGAAEKAFAPGKTLGWEMEGAMMVRRKKCKNYCAGGGGGGVNINSMEEVIGE